MLRQAVRAFRTNKHWRRLSTISPISIFRAPPLPSVLLLLCRSCVYLFCCCFHCCFCCYFLFFLRAVCCRHCVVAGVADIVLSEHKPSALSADVVVFTGSFVHSPVAFRLLVNSRLSLISPDYWWLFLHCLQLFHLLTSSKLVMCTNLLQLLTRVVHPWPWFLLPSPYGYWLKSPIVTTTDSRVFKPNLAFLQDNRRS